MPSEIYKRLYRWLTPPAAPAAAEPFSTPAVPFAGGRAEETSPVPTALPKWIEAIGRKLAEQFDVSREPLPAEMDIMLRLLRAEEYQSDKARREAQRASQKQASATAEQSARKRSGGDRT
jgi:hypothetical protein